MPDINQKFASIPVPLIEDVIQIVAAAKHLNYSFADVANVVNALNHFKGQSAREDGSQRVGELPPQAESGTSETAPV
jgi:hypothetical protein